MSDTPRTDALLLEINEGRVYENDGPVANLARELEREIEKLTRARNNARRSEDSLVAERDRLQGRIAEWEANGIEKDARIGALEQRLKEAKKDAARWRWLRANSLGSAPAVAVTYNIGHDYTRVTEMDELDSVVDAALSPPKPAA